VEDCDPCLGYPTHHTPVPRFETHTSNFAAVAAVVGAVTKAAALPDAFAGAVAVAAFFVCLAAKSFVTV
jgi:hypothetical protein